MLGKLSHAVPCDPLKIDSLARIDMAIHGAFTIEEIAYFHATLVFVHPSPATDYFFTTVLTVVQFHPPNIAEQNTHPTGTLVQWIFLPFLHNAELPGMERTRGLHF